MPDESPEVADPALSLATVGQLFEEFERRFPDYVFAGRGTTMHDGENGFVLMMRGMTDTRVGLIVRLRYAVSRAVRAEMDSARWLEEPDEDDE